MSPHPSNRAALIEGALRCLQDRGYAAVRTRDIAAAAEANLASIGYHFGSKDELLGQALREGFRRWLAEFAAAVPPTPAVSSRVWFQRLAETLRTSLEGHRSLALAFLEALARAPRDEGLRTALAESYREAQEAAVTLLGLGDDEAGHVLASVLLASFDGLLIRWLIDPPAIPGDDALAGALDRFADLLAEPPSR